MKELYTGQTLKHLDLKRQEKKIDDLLLEKDIEIEALREELAYWLEEIENVEVLKEEILRLKNDR